MQDRALRGDAALGCSLQGKGEERGNAVGKHRGAQHAPGTSMPPNDWGPWAYADPILWRGGCKVPTCFMLMHSWVEGGDLCRGSTAPCAQPLADI